MIFDKIDNELTRGRGADPDPVTVTDMFKVSERSMREREAVNSVDYLLEEEIDRVNEDVKRATGQEIINPIRNPYYRGQLSPTGSMTDTEGGAALNPLVERYAQSNRLRPRVDPYQDYRQQIEDLRSKFPDALDWAELGDRPFRETTRRARGAKAEFDALQERSGLKLPQDIPVLGKVPILSDVTAGVYNIFTSPGLMAGQMAGSLYGARHSPADIAANLIPGLAGARRLSIIQNAIRNGMTNAAAQAALEPFISENYERTGDQRTWEETYAAIAGAFGIGAALDLSIRTPGRAIAKASGAPGPYGGFLTSAAEVPSISRETAARAAAGDPDALREVTRVLGVDQDPAVKGAIDHLDTVGKVDTEAERAAQVMGIDNVTLFEQFDKMARAAADPDQAAVVRAPEPAIEARIKSEPDAAIDLMQRSPGALDALMGGIEARLGQIDARLPGLVQDAFEAGFGDVVPLVREAVDKIEAGRSQKKAINDFASSIAKLAEDPDFALRVALHSGRASPLEMARILRQRPDVAQASGLPASGALEARALAAMDDAAFEMVSRGDASLGAALAVADTVPLALQADVLGKLAEVKVTDPELARRLIPDLLPPDVATKAALLGVDPTARPKRIPGLVEEVEAVGKGAKAQTERLEEVLAPEIQEARAANALPQPDPKTVREALQRNADVRSAIDTALGAIGDAAKRKALEDRAKRILPEGVDVMVTDAPLVDPISGRLLDAVSDTTTGMIQLSTRALNPMARLGHEAGHTLVTLGRIDPRELAAMADAAIRDGVFGPEMAEAYRATYSARTKADGTPLNDPAKVERMVQEEAAMHYVEAVDKGTVGQTAPERTIAQKVLDFMRRLAVEFGVRNLRTPDEIARALLDGEMAERAAVKSWMRDQDITALAVKPEAAAVAPAASKPPSQSLLDAIARQEKKVEQARAALDKFDNPDQAMLRRYKTREGLARAADSANTRLAADIDHLEMMKAKAVKPDPITLRADNLRKEIAAIERGEMPDNFARMSDDDAERAIRAWAAKNDPEDLLTDDITDDMVAQARAHPDGMVAGTWAMLRSSQLQDRKDLLTALAVKPEMMAALSDLDMSPEARKQRAEQMGFDTGTVWYHGTTRDLDELTPGMRDPGVWFTTDKMNANNYARGDEARLYDVYLKTERPFVVENASSDEFVPSHGGQVLNIDNNVDIVNHAMRLGYDSVHFPDGNFSESGNTMVVFQSNQIRSTDAAFDPAQSSSPNLMFAFAGEQIDQMPAPKQRYKLVGGPGDPPEIGRVRASLKSIASQIGIASEHATQAALGARFYKKRPELGTPKEAVRQVNEARLEAKDDLATMRREAEGQSFYYDIQTGDGKSIGTAQGWVVGNKMHFDWLGAPRFSDKANIGLRAIKDLREQVRKDFPQVTEFVGYRVSGARDKADAENRMQSVTMFAFAGERAKTADLDALAKAKQMAADGIERTKIWTETGWFTGVDGKWRFEIDDSHVTLKDIDDQTIAESSKYEFAAVEARHRAKSLQILGSDVGEKQGSGGGTSLYHTLINDALENGKTVHSDGSVSQSAQRIYEGLKSRGYDVTQNDATRTTHGSLMGKAISLSKPLQPVYTIKPFADRNDANAVLARTTMARISMSPDERRARPPWQDYDVPEVEQVVRFANGENVSMFAFSSEPPVDGPAMQGLAMFAIRAFHGSPHDFDRFDMSKIGTGEGAQAYGHGLYFAENEGVARNYRDALQFKAPVAADGVQDGGPRALIQNGIREARKLPSEQRESALRAWLAETEQMAQTNKYAPPDMLENVKQARKLIESGTFKPDLSDAGRLYEVNIRAEPDDFLDWDKPLSQQSEKARNILDAEVKRSWEPDTDLNDKMMLQDVLRDRDAAKRLGDAGIPGIRYLDQGSRTAGEGSRNYVVFDDSLIEITAKDGKPVTAEDKAEIVAGMTKRDTGGSMFALRDAPVTPGLDMSPEARKARAEQMGFDTSRVWFNGSAVAPEAFSLDYANRQIPNAGGVQAVWFSSSPNRAEWYAEQHASRNAERSAPNAPVGFLGRIFGRTQVDPPRVAGPGAVTEAYIRTGKQVVIDMNDPANQDNIFALINAAKADGADTVVLKEHRDIPEIVDGVTKYLDELIVFDPKNIRSVNAAFDPARADSPNLMFALGDNQPAPDPDPIARLTSRLSALSGDAGSSIPGLSERVQAALDGLALVQQAAAEQADGAPDLVGLARAGAERGLIQAIETLGPERAIQLAGHIQTALKDVPADPRALAEAINGVLDAYMPEPMVRPDEPALAANDNIPTPLQGDLRDMDRMMMAIDFVGVCRL